MDAFLLLLRWFHFLFGITWIGILYYFNFVQVPFFAETEPAVRSGAIQKLVPRALWWFRWGAMGTVIVGIIYLLIWFRGTFPRFRYDQLMNIGWKVMIPIGMGAVMVNALLGMTRS